MASKLHNKLVNLISRAFTHASSHHERMRRDMAILSGQGYADDDLVGKSHVLPKENQVYPKISEVVNKFHPLVLDGSPRVYVRHDRAEDIEKIEVIQDFYDIYEEMDNEMQKMKTAAYQVLGMGMAIRKTVWRREQDRLSNPLVSPLSFAVDPSCTEVNLADADYVVHRNTQPSWYIRARYPWAKIAKSKDESHIVDEVWIRPRFAREFLELDGTETMQRAIVIDQKKSRLTDTHYWHPGFPFSCWRNFEIFEDNGLANSFWGYGFASFLWPQQKLYDDFLANLCLIMRSLAVGRIISTRGAINMHDFMLPIHFLNIQLGEGYTIQDILQLDPPVVPPAIFQFIQFLDQAMESLSGATPVLSGEAPFSGVSGRTVQALQAAANSVIANLIRGLIDFKAEMGRRGVVLIQQNAKRPVQLSQWRAGVDLREFPDEARGVGFHIEVQDTTSLPQSPAGRYQIAADMLGGGVITLEEFREIVDLDKAYGIRSEVSGNGAGGPAGNINADIVDNLQQAPDTPVNV